MLILGVAGDGGFVGGFWVWDLLYELLILGAGR